jgi:putative transcriptional regulator
MAFAAGRLPAGAAFVVCEHIARRDDARAAVAALDALCGIFLDAEAPAPMVSAPLARGGAGKPETDPWAGARARVAAAAGGAPARGMSWRWRPGWAEAASGVEGVSLLRIAPGAAIPHHGHSGRELTLVLCGAFEDAHGIYTAGDLACCTEDTEHRPAVLGGTPCVCLVWREGAPLFTSFWSRAAARAFH